MKIASILLSATALSLAACGQKADTTTADTNLTAAPETNLAATEVSTNQTTTAPAGGQAFANAAAASDAFEIATSKLALTTAHSAAVKKFAQKMIDAHTESTAKLKTAAGTITPDPTLSADQQQQLDDLKAKTGAEFDTAYVAAQTAGHQKTLDALKAYSATGDVAPLKAFATELVPTVTAHLNMAKGLKV